MVFLESKIEHTIYPLYVLEDLLEPKGFVIGPYWDNEKGYFDNKIDDISSILRIPFYAVAGSLNYPGVTVRVDKPFILKCEQQKEPDKIGVEGTVSRSLDQLQSSINPNTGIPGSSIIIGKELIQKVERILLP